MLLGMADRKEPVPTGDASRYKGDRIVFLNENNSDVCILSFRREGSEIAPHIVPPLQRPCHTSIPPLSIVN